MSNLYTCCYARLKTQTTHIRPMTPHTTTNDNKIMTIFWNKSKSDDQNSVCSSMKIAQQMPATIVTTIGMNGFASLLIIATHLVV